MPKDDEIDPMLLADLESYLKQIKAANSADTRQLVEILATKMWTLEMNQKLILDRLDELLRRTPPAELRAAPFN